LSESRFNSVENALKAKAEEVTDLANKVFVGEYTAPNIFPRMQIYARRVSVSESHVSGKKLHHTWRFEAVIDTESGSASASYTSIKRLFWSFYDKIMADRSLGLSGVFATPAVESELIGGTTPEGRFGHTWTMRVDVLVHDV